MPLKAPTWEPPRPFRPATPTRMTELAPSTRPDDLVPATVMVAAAARVVLRKSRRFWRVIGRPFVGAGEWLARLQRLYPGAGPLASAYRRAALHFGWAKSF